MVIVSGLQVFKGKYAKKYKKSTMNKNEMERDCIDDWLHDLEE